MAWISDFVQFFFMRDKSTMLRPILLSTLLLLARSDEYSYEVPFQGEIEKLKHEKHEMLAKKANAEARIQIQETLDGLSTEADIRALDNVREGINKLQAEADVGSELAEDDLDSKLEAIKEKTATASAKSQLEEMKKQMAAQKAAQDGKVEKTI